jgi:hypothetical protein
MQFNNSIIFSTLLISFVIYFFTLNQQKKDLYFHYNLVDNPESSAKKEIEVRVRKDNAYLKKVYTVAAILILWQGIWSPTNKFNEEMDLAKIQKSAYIASYQEGLIDQCQALFSRLGGVGNYAYGKRITLSYPQCLSLISDSDAVDAFDQNIGGFIRNTSEYEMKNNGRQQANKDLLNQIFLISPYWCYGVDCLSGSDFGIYRPY